MVVPSVMLVPRFTHHVGLVFFDGLAALRTGRWMLVLTRELVVQPFGHRGFPLHRLGDVHVVADGIDGVPVVVEAVQRRLMV